MLDELFIRGGPVLYVLFFITLLIFYILIDKYNFLLLNSKDWLNNQLSKFKEEFPPESTDFKIVDRVLLSSTTREFKSNIKILQGLISMCPMIGLLGTVYGMIEVFEVLSFLGTGNPRAMSSGVAMATIPTMSGMVITLFGLYFYQDMNGRIENLSKDFKVSSIPSLSSSDALSERFDKACSRLSITGKSSFKSFSTPYL